MKFEYFLVTMLFPLFGLSQKNKTPMNDTIIDKWIHATINVHGYESSRNQLDSIWELQRENKITWEDMESKQEEIRRNVQQFTGSAIFVHFNDGYYLLTARHILFDKTNPNGQQIIYNLTLIDNATDIHWPSGFADKNQNYYQVGGEITNLIISEFNCIISDEADDIGIIKIDHRNNDFLNTLFRRGYIPLELKDIDTTCKISEGDDIFIVGFPVETQREKKLPYAAFYWMAPEVSLPIISKGSIQNPRLTENTFEAGIFTYHGFSGGPVVRNNKLIGIVSGANLPPMTTSSEKLNSYYVFESRFIKSSLILPLLKRVEALSNYWEY